MHTDVHYQLSTGTWLLNIHPGNKRLYWDRQWKRGPFLAVEGEWTLVDVVKAAITAQVPK